MSNCCKAIRSKYPYCAVEIEMHSRDICFLLFYNNWTLHTTPIQLVSVLFIVVLRCPYSSLKFLILIKVKVLPLSHTALIRVS